jgi:hypothetical protein
MRAGENGARSWSRCRWANTGAWCARRSLVGRRRGCSSRNSKPRVTRCRSVPIRWSRSTAKRSSIRITRRRIRWRTAAGSIRPAHSQRGRFIRWPGLTRKWRCGERFLCAARACRAKRKLVQGIGNANERWFVAAEVKFPRVIGPSLRAQERKLRPIQQRPEKLRDRLLLLPRASLTGERRSAFLR